MTDEKNTNACPECGVDLTTGEAPKAQTFDRRAHAISHWGTDNAKQLTNPEAAKRLTAVVGDAKEKAEG